MLPVLGFFAGFVGLCSYVPYVHDIFVHKVKPERAAWFIWMVLAAITLSTQAASGATNSLWLSLFDTGAITLIFLLSIKFGEGGLTRRDVIGLVVAGIGLVLWFTTRNPVLALLSALVVDSSGFVLVILKAFKEPHTETYTMWVVVGFASIVSLISIGTLNPVLMVYPMYLAISHTAVIAAIYFGRRAIVPIVELTPDLVPEFAKR